MFVLKESASLVIPQAANLLWRKRASIFPIPARPTQPEKLLGNSGQQVFAKIRFVDHEFIWIDSALLHHEIA